MTMLGTLQAVELANVLRARMGTDSLAMIRESHGGLLALLEKHTAMFRVDRIPKNDSVTLQASDAQLLELNVEDVRRDAQAPGASRSYESGTIPETWTSSLAIPSRCLHVGNVAVSMTEDKLRQQFGAYGRIESLK